jgi:hypothetical protein
MARLHDSRRPLVVSFRRKKPATPRRPPKQVTIFDSDLQEPLTTLTDTTEEKRIPVVEVHSLQPTHICPLNVTKLEELGQKSRREKARSGSLNYLERSEGGRYMVKSCTMPEIGLREGVGCWEGQKDATGEEFGTEYLYGGGIPVPVN